jgi:lactobin A/cerein 7B family class IIb bacteriocin
MHKEHTNRFELNNGFEPTNDIRELTAAEVDDVSGGVAGLLLAAVVIGAIYVYDAYQIYKAVK